MSSELSVQNSYLLFVTLFERLELKSQNFSKVQSQFNLPHKMTTELTFEIYPHLLLITLFEGFEFFLFRFELELKLLLCIWQKFPKVNTRPNWVCSGSVELAFEKFD